MLYVKSQLYNVINYRLGRGVVSGVLYLGMAALPVGMDVAILKYRLYEIDGSSAGRWLMRS